MAAIAGNFFPADFKSFPFKEGDLLVSRRSDGKFAVNKVLKVDRIDIRRGEGVQIQGKHFTATEDDFLLVISCAYGRAEFSSMEEAQAAALAGTWTVAMAHVANRAPGAAQGQIRVGHQAVNEAELDGYRYWRAEFDKGEAGIF